MNRKYILFFLCLSLICLIWAAEGDFESAKKVYEKGRYKIAEVYFENILRDESTPEYILGATYYLIKIYDKYGDFLRLLSSANIFLDDYKYDFRCKEVFNLLLARLIEKEAFSIALDYVKNYDYLMDDYVLLEKIGYGLFKQNKKILADYVLSLCPQSDTIMILRASFVDDFSKKRELYESVEGVKGKIYLMESLLEKGDTIETYEIHRAINEKDIETSLLYRYAKISRLFNNKEFTRAVNRLMTLDDYKNKARLLFALENGCLDEIIKPGDQEECTLFADYLTLDTISKSPPDSMNIDAIIIDTLAGDDIISIKEKFGNCYFLDSVHTAILLDSEKIHEASIIIAPYLGYHNTMNYVRKIRGLKHYDEGKFRLAANDIILSHTDDPEMIFVLANSLTQMGKNSAYLYKRIIEMSKDSLLVPEAIKRLVRINFENRNYQNVVDNDLVVLQDDTSLVKTYIYSLARTGKKGEADTLFSQFFEGEDYCLVNYYGEYLIDKKQYDKAEEYYDSVIHLGDIQLPDILYYNWALIPFLQGQMDTALARFTFCIDSLRDSDQYYKALFKIATINYLRQEFDTAAYYYGIASEDDSLRHDASENQLISYKKSMDWRKVVETGERILPFVFGDKEAETKFEIGYALLRSGNARDGIEYLKMAAKSKSSPEFYYWLGEAYLGKGDFVRAIYQYQKIVELFPGDKMWTPTAQYKTGIAFEFMDELDEARRIYKEIIKKRGVGDTWGIEAQERLEEIEK